MNKLLIACIVFLILCALFARHESGYNGDFQCDPNAGNPACVSGVER